MNMVSKKELRLFERALAISAFSTEDAMLILQGYAIEKNNELRKVKEENEFIVKRLEDYEREANKGAYL